MTETTTVSTTQATIVVVRSNECKQEAVELTIADTKVPGVKFISPDARRFASVPKFFLDAIDWVKANMNDGSMAKEDFQKKMREIAIRDYNFPTTKDAQYFARWAEMSCLGYRNNPGWIAWLQPTTVEKARFYRVFNDGEAPMSATMLTRENSPTYGQATTKKPSARQATLDAQAARIAELESRLTALASHIEKPVASVEVATEAAEEAVEDTPSNRKRK